MKLHDLKKITDLARYGKICAAEGVAIQELQEELTRDLLLEGEVDTCVYHLQAAAQELQDAAQECAALAKKQARRYAELSADASRAEHFEYGVLLDFRGGRGEKIEKTRAKAKRYAGALRRLHKEYAPRHCQTIQARQTKFNHYYEEFTRVKAACAAAVGAQNWLAASKLLNEFEMIDHPGYHAHTNPSFKAIFAGYAETAAWYTLMREKVIPEEYLHQGQAAVAQAEVAAALPEIIKRLEQITALVQNRAPTAWEQYSRSTDACTCARGLKIDLELLRNNLETLATEELRQKPHAEKSSGRGT